MGDPGRHCQDIALFQKVDFSAEIDRKVSVNANEGFLFYFMEVFWISLTGKNGNHLLAIFAIHKSCQDSTVLEELFQAVMVGKFNSALRRKANFSLPE